MEDNTQNSANLAAAITFSASRQTYYTIRFLADRERVADAYRAYAYFRWVDDVIDTGTDGALAFARRQKSLLEACYRGESPEIQHPEEWMLVDMVRGDTEKNSGLQAYLRNMMAVMLFDAARRGQTVSQAELDGYSHKLAVAVTEALYHFIGHDDPSPNHSARYLAVTAAHIVHMLRDTVEDVEAGYFNIPQEVLQARGISPQEIGSKAYRKWVCERIRLARSYFDLSQVCTSWVKNWRCRLAGYAYTARFRWMLNAIERDNFCIRAEYPERKGLGAGLWMSWQTLVPMFAPPVANPGTRKLVS